MRLPGGGVLPDGDGSLERRYWAYPQTTLLAQAGRKSAQLKGEMLRQKSFEKSPMLSLLFNDPSIPVDPSFGTLPLTVDTSYHAPAPEPEPGARLDGVRILMAEDNALNREIATYMFEERGALVTAAEDGQQAVDRFAASAPSSFDIILMDIMMPVLDGLDAARAIRVLDRTDARTVPILAVSANAFSDDIAASREAGMNGHLSKPLDFDRVAAVIAQYIRRS